MTDHFAAFQLPRRPWLDSAALHEHFHRLTATLHPDVPGTGDAERFAALNAAHATLREPALRLRHLLDLEFPEAGQCEEIPETVANFFPRMAGLRRETELFRERCAAASTALARALLTSDRAALLRRLQTACTTIDEARDELLETVRSLDAQWDLSAPTLAAPLAFAQAGISYFGKWSAQLRETIFQLTEA